MNETISYRNIWRISYPLILSFLATSVINITDTAFMGRISDVALGATGLGGIYFLIFLMTSVGLGIGAQIIMARYHGEGNLPRIGRVFDHLLYLMVFLGFALIGLHFLIGPSILDLVIESDAILDACLEYMDIRSISFLPSFLAVGYRSFLTGVSRTRAISYSSGIMAVLNLIFNYAFVFGNFGCPRMEIEGAAWASVLSETFGLIYLMVWVRYKQLGLEFSAFQFKNPDFAVIRNMLKVGFPIMVQHVVALISWLTFFLMIEGMGERALAISNVVRGAYSILMVPLIGIAQATQTLVSSLIGQGGTELVPKLIKRLVIVCVGSSFVIMALNWIDPQLSLSIFTNDAVLVQESLSIIPIISISILIFALGVVLISVVSGTGNTRITLYIEAGTLVLYLSYLYVVVHGFHASLEMVWTSEFVYFTMISLFSWLYLRTGKWKGTKVHD
ncbi:MAG: MATE family efflux transporter [Flavobacteriales bacterium]|nr:MATE family efflux transporter [Flavobacteriales bacterium]MCB9192261.1 MATE family efflux transporter [Flavobacteriales bacterium]